jgi:hypothetical protein
MAKPNVAKFYDQLNGEERLRLVIEALARGDEIEVQRLVHSCPRKNYSDGDDAYVVPLKATYDLVQAACHDLDRGRGRLQALDSVQLMISRLIEALSELDKVSQETIETIIGILEGLSEMQITPFRVAMLAGIKAVHKALGKFFQDKLDLSPDTLLKAFAPPYWEWLDDLKEEISGVEVDPERVAEFEKRLAGC